MAKKQSSRPRPTEFEIDVEGKPFKGRFVVEGGMITVSSAYGSKRTHVGASLPEVLARIMLSELVGGRQN